MKLGKNKVFFLVIFFTFLIQKLPAEDKILSAPLLNLEKLKPSFEEIDQTNSDEINNDVILNTKNKNNVNKNSSTVRLIGLDKITAKTSEISLGLGEIKKFGPYKMLDPHRLSRHEPAAKNEDENPYVKAFWEWMPSIYKGLDTLRITGGEPLLSKNTFKLLDFFEKNPNPDLTLALNCNLCVRDEILDKFLNRLEEVWSQGNIKKCDFYISVDIPNFIESIFLFHISYNSSFIFEVL